MVAITNRKIARASATSSMSATTTLTELPLASVDLSLEGHDAEQIRLMEERLILLDPDDNVIGEGSKKECEQSGL